jgi:lipopolysaccharide/colanic/teichoic acid biosynthesis glycosyltransferase
MNQEMSFPIKQLGTGYRVVKRLLDITLGSMLLLLSMPIILIAALAIRLETKGNPFFFQQRVGLGGKPFRIVKLRGMFIDARQRFAELYNYKRHATLDFHFHPKKDPRVTKVGAFLRRTSIDELPNFWNVVVGDMTLVGPRPEVPDLLDLYGECKTPYVSIKPGITCISKISGRDSLSKRDSIELDLEYMQNMGIGHDCQILWKTLEVVLLRRDVRDGKSETNQIEVDAIAERQNTLPSTAQNTTEA